MQLATEELRAAVLNARAAALNAEIAGMVAENQHRLSCGNSVAYVKDDFDQTIENNGLGENGVIHVSIHGVL